MNKSMLICVTVSVLLACCTLLTYVAEPSEQPTSQATVGTDAPKPPFSTPLKWKSSGVLVKPISDTNHTIVSVKDPTIVHYDGLWYICNSLLDICQNMDYGVPEL